MYYLPVRKIIKLFWTKRVSAGRERESLTLTECLNKSKPNRRNHRKNVLLVILLLTTMYCMHLLMSDITHNYATVTDYTNVPTFKSSEDANATLNNEYKKSRKLQGRKQILPFCYLNWVKFDKVAVNKTITTFSSEKEYPTIQKGGYYRPEECTPRHKVGILVPYRDRKANLAVFLYNIHPFLMRQKLEYRIFVIEQKGTEQFNRGRLFNVGYLELKKFGWWQCVVFHDVDLLPLDERILYTCPTWPRHMSATVVEVTDPKFRTSFGGVSSMSPHIMEAVNGFSNYYWGWGGEDDDMFRRIRYSGYPVVRYNKSIAHYTSLSHPRVPSANRFRYSLLRTTGRRYKKEGLSSLRYKIESVALHHLYTHILADINPNQENITELLEQLLS